MPKPPDATSAAYSERERGFAPNGAIVVRKSTHPTHPFYLQKVINAWDEIRYYGVHALIGEEFATIEEAEARAAELAR